jgi:hypothetical protein
MLIDILLQKVENLALEYNSKKMFFNKDIEQWEIYQLKPFSPQYSFIKGFESKEDALAELLK